MIAKLDKFGRIIIPKKLREQFGIDSQSTLNIETTEDGIFIRSVQDEAPVIEKNGILVFTGRLQGKVDQLLIDDRSERSQKLLGEL